MIPILIALCFSAPDFESLTAAFEAAADGKRWKEARKAAAAVGELKGPRVGRWLERRLEDSIPRSVKRTLFAALVFRRRPAQRELVQDSLKSQEDPFYRAQALRALATFAPGEVVGEANHRLEYDDDRRVRQTAVGLLAERGAVREIVVRSTRCSSPEQTAILGTLRALPTDKLMPFADLSWTKRPDVRTLALLAVVARGEEAFRPAFQAGSKDKNPHVRLVAAIGLARLAGAEARAKSVGRILKRARSFQDRWELYDLIERGGLRDQALVEALTNAAKRGDKKARAKAATALGHAGGAAAVPTLTALLRLTKPWQVPIGAARGLGGTRAAEAIPPLIAALGKTTGRLRLEIALALGSLTGQPFGRNPEVWSKWWAAHETGFKPPAVETVLWEEDTDADDGYVFYGIDLVSDRAAFVCDKSGSMAQNEKLDRLKVELATVLRRFPEHGRYGLVFFDDKVESVFGNRMVPANKKNREKALDRVTELKAEGATNIWAALEVALTDKTVDTIVLLTDGAPTAGKNATQIRDEFRKLNRDRMVLLHVIAIGIDAPFLAEAARLSGGTYVRR